MNGDPSNGDPSNGDARLDVLANSVRQLRVPFSARQRLAGWQRLQERLASRRTFPDPSPSGWWPRWGFQLGLALALFAIAVPFGWRLVMTAGSPPLQYVVSGPGGLDAPGVTGGIVSAFKGRAQLLFTDGSRIGLRNSARLTVAALEAKGSRVRLLDGTIDVDVRHQPGTSWTFEAGPYAVHVRGTSFALGWDVAQKHLTVRMLSGVVALVGPPGKPPLTVVGGESVFLDEAGNPLAAAASGDAELTGSSLASAGSPPPGAYEAKPSLGSPQSPEAPPPGVDEVAPPDRRLARAPFAHAEWAPLLASGHFDDIIEQAKKSGVAACLASDSEPNLAVLADAARYTHRSDLARRSLLALRARFPATDRARDAAFFLARLSETTSTTTRGALSWYDRYLDEAAGGSYAEEALGREMILLRRNEGSARARSVASRYLRAYPHGIYVDEAAGLLENTSTP